MLKEPPPQKKSFLSCSNWSLSNDPTTDNNTAFWELRHCTTFIHYQFQRFHKHAQASEQVQHERKTSCSELRKKIKNPNSLPDKEERCAGPFRVPPRRGCPSPSSRHTTASSSPCSVHTAEAREDVRPHVRDTCTEWGKQEGMGGQTEEGRDRVREGTRVKVCKTGHIKGVGEGKWVVEKERERKRDNLRQRLFLNFEDRAVG